MASQPSAMPASRWRSNHFLLQPSRRWIWFFIVGAVLAGSVTSAPEARADTGCFRRLWPIPPFWKTSFKQALIDRVIDQSTPEEFLQYFIDHDDRPQDEDDLKLFCARMFVFLQKYGLISPEQVAERVKDVTKVLHAFVAMHSEKKLKTLECDYSNQNRETFISEPKFSSEKSIGRLLALYERQPKEWLDKRDFRGFYVAFREIILGKDFDRSYEWYEKDYPLHLLRLPFEKEVEKRLYIRAVLAYLPGLKYQLSILPEVFKTLFDRKCWTYSDLCLPTISHVFSQLHDRDLKLNIIIRIFEEVYKEKERFDFPKNVLDHVIRKMFWELDETSQDFLLDPEALGDVNINDFAQKLKNVVNPPPGSAEEDFDISKPQK